MMLRVLLVFILIVHQFLLARKWSFPQDFLWGIANAPAHVEDHLNDIWLEHAKKGKVYAYKNTPQPSRRVDFWSRPEIEIELAAELGVKVFRLGVDWGRIEPKPGKYDLGAIKHYQKILKLIKSKGMKVMLTLFHHSEPAWTLSRGGWKNELMIKDFVNFSEYVLKHLGEQIDFLITFNEAHIYSALTEIEALWPNQTGKKNTLGFIFGTYSKMLEHISKAHKQVYKKSKQLKIPTSIAHNLAYYTPSFFLLRPIVSYMTKKMNYELLEYVWEHLDFLGINYYGSETVGLTGLKFDKKVTYSDSGRGIYPEGLYKIIKDLNKKFSYKKLPIFITENGIADELDRMRPAYMIEHLKVISKLISEGVDIMGYIHWTLSDNWEWVDGYCPKFGLVAVDRKSSDLKRHKRESFYLYEHIIKQNSLNSEQEKQAWEKYEKSVSAKHLSLQPLCRAKDGKTPLDDPRMIFTPYNDWRFTIK